MASTPASEPQRKTSRRVSKILGFCQEACRGAVMTSVFVSRQIYQNHIPVMLDIVADIRRHRFFSENSLW